jgi:hypothetical protein
VRRRASGAGQLVSLGRADELCLALLGDGLQEEWLVRHDCLLR